MSASRKTRFIKNPPLLKKILWMDAMAGGLTALAGLVALSWTAQRYNLDAKLLLTVYLITGVYAGFALYLATRRQTPVKPVRWLVVANWVWTGVAVALFFLCHKQASAFGDAFLVLQVLVVGCLAWAEGVQITS